MSRTRLRAKSTRRHRHQKKRSEFRRSPFGGQQQTFDRTIAPTAMRNVGVGMITAIVNALFRRGRERGQ